jgi:hypothetical protein
MRHIPFTKKESPDVETPGLLVKALISSYFKKRFLKGLMQIYSPVTNRARNFTTILVVFLRFKHMLIMCYTIVNSSVLLFHPLQNP